MADQLAIVVGDQAGSALEGEIGPGPFEEHHRAVAKADEKEDVDQQPGPPGEQPRQLEARELRDRARAADGRQRALVAIVERLDGLAREDALNLFGRVLPALDR